MMDRQTSEMTSSSKIERIRFNVYDDLSLLRNVVGLNPFEDPKQWVIIHMNLNKESQKNFSLRAVKEHTEHLLKLFRKEDFANLKKSGTEEQFNEKEKLLQEVSDLEGECHKKKARAIFDNSRKKLGMKSRDLASGVNIRKETAQKLENVNVIEFTDAEVEVVEDAIPIALDSEQNFKKQIVECHAPKRENRNKLLKNNALKFLEERNKNDGKLKEKELQLEERRLNIEERKLQLEEEKLELEKEERSKRLKIEVEERQLTVDINRQQFELLQYFIKNKD